MGDTQALWDFFSLAKYRVGRYPAFWNLWSQRHKVGYCGIFTFDFVDNLSFSLSKGAYFLNCSCLICL